MNPRIPGRPRRRRSLARPLACLLLAAATVASPLESALVPAPLDHLTGAPPAAAQTAVPDTFITGTPNKCKDTAVAKLPELLPSKDSWDPQPRADDYNTAPDCTLELPACTINPFYEDSYAERTDIDEGFTRPYLRISVPPNGWAEQFPAEQYPQLETSKYPDDATFYRYPDFCEVRFEFDCWNQGPEFQKLRGHVNLSQQNRSNCQVLHPLECPAGMYRMDSVSCRVVVRRTWTCPDGYTPRNTFNYCGRHGGDTSATHPACGDGAPDFYWGSCEDYVGGDFFASPGDVLCASRYLIGSRPALAGAPTAQFGTAFGPSSAGGTGSSHWCEYDLRYLNPACHQPGGVGCVLEPSSALCIKRPSETGGCDRIAASISCRVLQAAFREKEITRDYVLAQGCEPCFVLPFEPTPPRCVPPVSTSDTLAGDDMKVVLAVGDDFAISKHIPGHTQRCVTHVLTPEDLEDHPECKTPVCDDPPGGRLTWRSTHSSQLGIVNSPIILSILDIPLALNLWGRGGPHEILYWSDNRGYDARYRSFNKSTGKPTAMRTYVEYECSLFDNPMFEIRVQELWPDLDSDEMKLLFGKDSLAWWEPGLSDAEKKSRTEARGFTYMDSTSTDTEKETERSARAGRLERWPCELDGGMACEWLPSGSGYFAVTGGGAWKQKLLRERDWAQVSQGGRGEKPGGYNNLNNMLYAEDNNIALDAACSHPGPWQSQFVCRNRDSGFWDTNPGPDSANFTETEPVGIVVHEARIRTVAPQPTP